MWQCCAALTTGATLTGCVLGRRRNSVERCSCSVHWCCAAWLRLGCRRTLAQQLLCTPMPLLLVGPNCIAVLRFLIASREEVDSVQLRDDLLSMLVGGFWAVHVQDACTGRRAACAWRPAVHAGGRLWGVLLTDLKSAGCVDVQSMPGGMCCCSCAGAAQALLFGYARHPSDCLIAARLLPLPGLPCCRWRATRPLAQC